MEEEIHGPQTPLISCQTMNQSYLLLFGDTIRDDKDGRHGDDVGYCSLKRIHLEEQVSQRH